MPFLRSFKTWPNGSRDFGEPQASCFSHEKSLTKTSMLWFQFLQDCLLGGWGTTDFRALWMISDDFRWFWAGYISCLKKNKEKSATGNSFPDLGGAQQLRSGSNIILAGGGWGFLSRFVEINYWIGCFDPDTSGLSRDLFESYFFLDICWILKMFPATNKVGFTETGCTQTQESCYGQLLIIRGCPINLLL